MRADDEARHVENHACMTREMKQSEGDDLMDPTPRDVLSRLARLKSHVMHVRDTYIEARLMRASM